MGHGLGAESRLEKAERCGAQRGSAAGALRCVPRGSRGRCVPGCGHAVPQPHRAALTHFPPAPRGPRSSCALPRPVPSRECGAEPGSAGGGAGGRRWQRGGRRSAPVQCREAGLCPPPRYTTGRRHRPLPRVPPQRAGSSHRPAPRRPPAAPCRASRGQRRPGPGGDPRGSGGDAPGPGMALRAAPERASSSRTVRTLRDRRASARAEGPRAPAGEPRSALPSSDTPGGPGEVSGRWEIASGNLPPKSCRVPKKRRGAGAAAGGARVRGAGGDAGSR